MVDESTGGILEAVSTSTEKSNKGSKQCKGDREKYETIIANIPPSFIYEGETVEEKTTTLEEIIQGQASAVGFAVVDHGKIDCVGAVGKLIPNDSDSPSITTDTLFPIASIGKAMTAYATIRCLQDKKLDLDQTIDKYFPPIPTTYPFAHSDVSAAEITGEQAADFVSKISEHLPAKALEQIAQLKAWSEKEKPNLDMTAINKLEQEILEQHEFLYGTFEVRKILQKFKGHKITFRQLLEHSSGINDNYPLPKKLFKNYEPPFELSIAHLQNALMTPLEDEKKVWRYSNTGYLVVECALESLMKKPFPQIMQEYVFAPLEMKSSTASQSSRTLQDSSKQFVWGLSSDGTTRYNMK